MVEKEYLVRGRACSFPSRSHCGRSVGGALRCFLNFPAPVSGSAGWGARLALAGALLVLALTAACAPRLATEGPEMRMPAIERSESMSIAGDRYVTRDGLRLGLSHWD